MGGCSYRIGDAVYVNNVPSESYIGYCHIESVSRETAVVINRHGELIKIERKYIAPRMINAQLFRDNGFSPVEGWKEGTFERKFGTPTHACISAFPMNEGYYYVEIENDMDNIYIRARIRFVHEFQHLLEDSEMEKEFLR